MGTFHDLPDRLTTPERTVTDHDMRALIAIGGYTHPLFTDPGYAAATPFGRTPLPGQAVLHLVGGLVEQTGAFDDTVIALAGFEGVRFLAPAFAGDTLHVEIEVLAREPHDTSRAARS